MEIILKDASAEEWRNSYDKDIDATYSQSFEWNRLWADFSKYELVPKIVYKGTQRVGLLPLAVKKHGVERQYLSGINGYGGLLNPSIEAIGDYDGIMRGIAERLKSFRAICNPFTGYSMGHWPMANKDHGDGNMSVQYLDLRDGFEAQFRKWSKGHSSAAKKGIRDGVTVRSAQSVDDWRAYYTVYEDSLRRWGKNATSYHPWELFSTIRSMADPRIILWVAESESRIIAGSLCLYGHRHIAYWHGAVEEASFEKKAPHVLQYEIAKDAASRGFFWYDMLTSGSLEGVSKFKHGFAADILALPVYSQRPLLLRTISSLKRKITQKR